MKNTILNGNSLEMLKLIPENYIDSCVTSPPYYGLRDYGVDGQLGLEETPDMYIENMVSVFREVRRVLKEEGTLWLNIGDSYNGQTYKHGYKPKELMGIPWRLALALQSDGWYLRSDIIWHKPNPMPESVKDRPTKAHEYVFLLTKSPKYYYDYVSIAEESKTKTKSSKGSNGKYGDEETEKKHRQGLHSNRGDNLVEFRPFLPSQKEFVDFLRARTSVKNVVDNTEIKKSKVDHWFRYDKSGFSFPSVEDWNEFKWIVDDWSDKFKEIDHALTTVDYKTDEVKAIKEGYKNKRSVWTVPTKAFRGAHFAAFPVALIEPCVIAGCPENGTVLDPFFGSGTTGETAIRNNRNFIGVELNPEYIVIANNRLEAVKNEQDAV